MYKVMADAPGEERSAFSPIDSQWQGERGRIFSTESGGKSEEEIPQYRAQNATTLIEHLARLEVFDPSSIMRNTGIVCTIGEHMGRTTI